jgi:hypothetical protein
MCVHDRAGDFHHLADVRDEKDLFISQIGGHIKSVAKEIGEFDDRDIDAAQV